MRLPIIASSNLLSIVTRALLYLAQRRYCLVELPVEGIYIVRGIGIDYHKTGFTPYISSAVLLSFRAFGRSSFRSSSSSSSGMPPSN